MVLFDVLREASTSPEFVVKAISPGATHVGKDCVLGEARASPGVAAAIL
jgi:hypothetical protein